MAPSTAGEPDEMSSPSKAGPAAVAVTKIPVSYTHLDVYKRQAQYIAFTADDEGMAAST